MSEQNLTDREKSKLEWKQASSTYKIFMWVAIFLVFAGFILIMLGLFFAPGKNINTWLFIGPGIGVMVLGLIFIFVCNMMYKKNRWQKTDKPKEKKAKRKNRK